MPDARTENSGQDRGFLLTGDLRRTVFVLALPVLCEQFLSFCVGFFDTFLSGRISSEATTAIGLAAYVGWLASLMFGLVGTGTTALVSRHWGAREFEQAGRVTNRSMALAAVLGLVVYALIFSVAPVFAQLLGMQAETRQIVVRYLRVDGLGYLFTSLSLIGAAAMRGAGDMRSPMLILGLVSILNVIISSALVFGIGPVPALGIDWPLIPKMGIHGIVTGTVLSRMTGGVLMVIALSRGRSGLRLSRRELKVRGEMVRRILRVGSPAALDGMLVWAGHFLFLMIIAKLGGGRFESAAFAAHIVGIEIEAITYLPAVAWGYAAATMIGQSLGAEDRKRAVKAGHEAVLQCSLLGAVITIAFYAGAPAIYRIMHEDPAVREVGIPAFRMLAFFQIPLVLSITYVFGLRGAGDTRYPLLINSFGVFCIRLPVAYLCGIVWQMGLIGAWIGMCCDVTVRAALVSVRFIRGRWLTTRV